jgi:CMP-N-acetylneuraminic acid synthetase
MNNNIAVVIPALECNRYYPDGDMVQFGDTTLLEWKISQVLEVINKENVYISTPSNKIIKLAQNYGLNFVKRDDGNNPDQYIAASVEPIKKENILWTHATSPFVSAKDYRSMLEVFFNLPNQHDSLITVYKEEEYIYFRNTPLNFNVDKFKARGEIDPIYRVTNGCYITPKKSYLENQKFFGNSAYFYEVDKLTSLEIKNITHYEMALDLISMYFKAKVI